MIIFLLGVPGCGKSEFYRRLVKRLKEAGSFNNFARMDDFPKLWAIFQEDEKSGSWQRSRPTEDGGYKVTDETVWDDILKAVNKDLSDNIEKYDDGTLLFVEFARPNYVHSIMNNFSEEIIEQAIGVYLDVPFDICWERNVRRHEQAIEAGTDDHLVSREEMEETYGSDDKDKLKIELPFSIIFVNNDAKKSDDFTRLDEGVENVFSVIQKEL